MPAKGRKRVQETPEQVLDRLRQKVADAQDDHDRAVASLEWLRTVGPTISSEEDRAQLAAIAYWEHDTRAAWIATELGFKHINHMVLSLPPYPSGVACRCGAEIYARSRSDMLYACDACKVRRSQDDTAWQARQEAMRRRLHELRTMPYRLYLQTPEWRERRGRQLATAAYRCQVCNARDRLQVHHRTYERRGAEYNRDLIVLCDGCHELFHRNGKLAKGAD